MVTINRNTITEPAAIEAALTSKQHIVTIMLNEGVRTIDRQRIYEALSGYTFAAGYMRRAAVLIANGLLTVADLHAEERERMYRCRSAIANEAYRGGAF